MAAEARNEGEVQAEVVDEPLHAGPALVDEGMREPRLAITIAGCGKLYRARSRLYRNEILQENMRLKALAEIYTMHSFAQLCNLNFLSKICQNFC